MKNNLLEMENSGLNQKIRDDPIMQEIKFDKFYLFFMNSKKTKFFKKVYILLKHELSISSNPWRIYNTKKLPINIAFTY